MRHCLTKLLMLMLTAAACTAQQSESPLTNAQRVAITDTVRKATSDFIAAVEHVDNAKASPFFSHGPDFTFASNGDAWTGWDSFQGLFNKGWKGLRSQRIAVVKSSISVLSPTTVMETLSTTGDFVDTAGKKSLIDKAALTFLWVRDSSGWKILSLHQSFPEPKAH